jgi:hypothetical protein
MRLLPAIVAASLALCPALAAAAPTLDQAFPAIAADVAAGRPLVVHVVVALCSNEQIDCGSGIAGRPGDLEHNVYWGAVFGARRFFDRPRGGWTRVGVEHPDEVELERVVHRRMVAGAAWGRAEPVEVLIVLSAIHGASIDAAVDRFWTQATEGGRVTFRDGDQVRSERVSVVGYAGHNRLMDGRALPSITTADRSPIPSFVVACKSDAYFAEALSTAGSSPLITTRALMAPEGYVLDAIARGLAENRSVTEVRARAVDAYATWLRLDRRDASWVFAPR